MMTCLVCLFVCLSASIPPELHVRSLPDFFVHVTHIRGSVLLWRHCITLCNAGFMDDVIFVRNGSKVSWFKG